MVTYYRLALTLVAGVAIGAGIVTGLRAQGTPAYVIIDVAEVTDSETYKTIIANAPTGLLPYGGRYIIRTDKTIALDGTPPRRFVVIAFDSVELAQRWSTSGPLKEITALRVRTTKSRSFIVQGLPS